MTRFDGDLANLSRFCKKDPVAYVEEFEAQLVKFTNLVEVFKHSPNQPCEDLIGVSQFLASLVTQYRAQLAHFADDVIALLEEHAATMDASLRLQLVKCLISLRVRDEVEPLKLLPLFFRLLRIHDKPLRATVFGHVITDIVQSNKKRKQPKVNARLQAFLAQQIAGDVYISAKKAMGVLTELYR
ncbi:Sda1 protein, partial [Kipferlia bialata]|eukprot:g10835.t1